MSDEKVIAELEDLLRVTERGLLQEWNDPGPRGRPGWWETKASDERVPATAMAELLADAVRRVREDYLHGIGTTYTRLVECIGSLEDENARIRDRVVVLEKNVASHVQEIGMTNEDVAMHTARLRTLESRLRDEAGEGAIRPCDGSRSCTCSACLAHDTGYQKGCGEGYNAGRAELAREIVAGVREASAGSWHGDYWADWIEREYGGE